MARKRSRELLSASVLNLRRSDPEMVKARKMARVAKELGPNDTSLGRTRQATRFGYVERPLQQPRAAKVYHVTDPRPEFAILPILQKFKNKNIRIVAYSGTQAEYVRHLIDEGYKNGMLVNVASATNVVTRTVFHNFEHDPTWRASTNEDGKEVEPRVGDATYAVGDNPKQRISKTSFF